MLSAYNRMLSPDKPAAEPRIDAALVLHFAPTCPDALVKHCVAAAAADGLQAEAVGERSIHVRFGARARLRAEAEQARVLKFSKKEGAWLEYLAEAHDAYEPMPAGAESLFCASEELHLLERAAKQMPSTDEVERALADARLGSLLHSNETLLGALERLGLLQGVHRPHARAELRALWRTHGSLTRPLDPAALDAIRAYFGPAVGFYFAWLDHTTCWYIPAGAVGACVFAYHRLEHVTVDNSPIVPFFTVGMLAWALAQHCAWRRAAARLAVRWGVFEPPPEAREPARPGYTGELRMSPVTLEPERHFPPARRVWRYAVSAVVTAAMLCLALCATVASLNLQGYVDEAEAPLVYVAALRRLSRAGALFDPAGPNRLLANAPAVIHVLAIRVLNTAYSHVAAALTAHENHRTQREHDAHLASKRFLFEAVDAYASLFYLAFVQLDVVSLRAELCSLYTTDSVRRALTEAALPRVLQWFGQRRRSRELGRRKQSDGDAPAPAAAWADEAELDEYAAFDDYLEMVIQLGYVSLFASAFPLAALLSAGCTLVESRSDLWKITHVSRRPAAEPAGGIGVWQPVALAIVLSSILSNAVLFAYASDQLQQWAPSLFDPSVHHHGPNEVSATSHAHFTPHFKPGMGSTVALIVVAAEHVALLVAAAVLIGVPNEPDDVAITRARRQWVLTQRRAATTS